MLFRSPCLEEHVESRDQEDAKRRGHAHSEEHRRAYVQAASCAGSGCEEHGQDAANARDRRHHDGTESFRPRLGGGLEDRQAAHVVLFHGELDDEDRILRRKPYQKEDPELGVDANGNIHDHDPDQRSQEGDREGQNDTEGDRPALVLSDQEEVAEDQRNAQDENDLTAGLIEIGRASCRERV